ncbi:hypothetical protein ASPWEDRAFT_497760 [Aspergillus wentii DTO 134E9]|uniref:Uncharacterized protein n=1 Tax=Aspergillus wentii DTO 134E9 TaxID=1073089 RepID=A0A1L9RJS7_ASPWE|nr:uncharacterized protein ASPWEDRAFT_497760 [Aspergillus wentii DTO 134E9]OJJ35182.1 hypothetical protein ASPWEDRAFT_497760 [Aspergillus wentii DTO 134E9]
MENTVVPNYLQESSLLAPGLLYPAFCITCVLVFFYRIKRQRREWYRPPGRQMDSKSLPPGKSSGKQPAATAGQHMSTSGNVTASPFPSACDVLRPLSQTTSLPSSGHVAATVLGQKNHDQAQPPRPTGTLPAAHSHSLSNQSSSTGSEATRRPSDSSEGSGDESRQHPVSLSAAASQPIEESQRPAPGTPDSNRRPVQKNNETTQNLYDVDTDGVRTWKRLIVEYN